MSAVRHKAPTRALARQLRKGGWSFAEIQQRLADEGIYPIPSTSTIHCWTNEKVNDRQRRHKRASGRRKRAATANFRWPGVRGPEWRIERIRRLSQAGMTSPAIALVMSFDFPEQPMSDHQVRGVLGGSIPQSLRRLA